jgi:transcriptional regulator with XRE-family HTH domain
MTRKTLGRLVKEGRKARDLTQRELGQLLGVRGSHIAYIENGQRKPSLALLGRIAKALGFDSQELLFISRPDARELIHFSSASRPSQGRENAWRTFVKNRGLLKRHRVTRGELNILKRVSLLENVSSPRHFLFILNAIRQAGDRDSWTFD